MTDEISDLISDYERAKNKLESLFSQGALLNDSQIRALDQKIGAAYRRIVDAEPASKAERRKRVFYLLQEVRSTSELSGLCNEMLSILEKDIGCLISSGTATPEGNAIHNAAANSNSPAGVCRDREGLPQLAADNYEEFCHASNRQSLQDDIS